jgi:hypothetical protein
MFVRIEPKDFNMYSVFFVFNKQQADPADSEVRAYLQEHALEPKRQWDEVWHGADCNIMYFGGCYIERHMKPIGEMHRRGAQLSLLRRAVDGALNGGRPSKALTAALAALPKDRLDEVKASLVERLNVDTSFGTDKKGYLAVTVPKATLRREFLILAGTMER